MLLAFVPWLVVSMFDAGPWVALHTFGYAVLVFSVGYGLVNVMLPTPIISQAILIVPAAGILVLSALTAFWLRLGLPLIWVSIAWIILFLVGAAGLWHDRNLAQKATVEYGGALVALSTLICVVYFSPGALNDAVLRSDGSFNWMYFDMPYFHSMAANIKYSNGPPTMPGTATAQLYYHFGPYAQAATISCLTGVSLGDALVRVTRGVQQWALVFSCFGLGTFLSLKATGGKFGGVMSVAGLFFYGSISVVFHSWSDGYTLHEIKAILFNVPGLAVPADGGPFDHLMEGHSCLHGLGAITVVMSLCMYQSEQSAVLNGRAFTLLLLPALVVPVHSVAALYCVGIVAILLLWGHLTELRSWLAMMLILGLFLTAWKLMGYGHNPDAAHAMVNPHPTWLWWPLSVWFIVGLGFRIVGFNWISLPLKDPLSALVLASVIGLLSFFMLLQLRDENQKYGLYYLQAMLSVFAFSRLTPGFWRGVERSNWAASWLDVAKWGMILLTSSGFLIILVGHLTRHDGGITHLNMAMALLFLLFLAGCSLITKWSFNVAAVSSAILMGVLLIGFLAWVPVWFMFSQGWGNRGITIASGEVQGLKRLSELSSPGERFATNKHVVRGMVYHPERSYGYSALAERPVLLEGYLVGGEQDLPRFETLLHDNDLLFTTTNSATLREIANSYNIKWLVTQPGTDLALPRPLPAWLEEKA
ncbi:MAG TPA: hypothetical protein VNX46_04040, partial [Candidatus Acidoferrum sp.]|nr:hypothetical protein [Candidatus Acidoferrum sp.]